MSCGYVMRKYFILEHPFKHIIINDTTTSSPLLLYDIPVSVADFLALM